MVLTLLIPVRKWFKLEHLITIKHLENMAKIILPDRFARRLRLLDGVLHRLVLG